MPNLPGREGAAADGGRGRQTAERVLMTPFQRWRMKAFLFGIGVYRRMTIGVRGILLDGDRVCLIKHSYVPGWHFPGGGVEPGETALDSLMREVEEETGHRLTGPAELMGLYLNRHGSDRDHVACYVCRQVEKVRDITPGLEIVASEWFALGELPADTTPGTRARLAELFGGKPQSQTW